MHDTMKPLFTRERAMHFLRETVVSSMEGMLFVLLSALFTLAGAAALLEDLGSKGGLSEMTAKAAPAPPSPIAARHSPQQVAVAQAAHLPAVQ